MLQRLSWRKTSTRYWQSEHQYGESKTEAAAELDLKTYVIVARAQYNHIQGVRTTSGGDLGQGQVKVKVVVFPELCMHFPAVDRRVYVATFMHTF